MLSAGIGCFSSAAVGSKAATQLQLGQIVRGQAPGENQFPLVPYRQPRRRICHTMRYCPNKVSRPKSNMRCATVTSAILTVCGSILLAIALLSGAASVLSLIGRLHHGAGLMFADVEFFGFTALIFTVAGGLAVFGATKISIPKPPDAC